MLQHKNEEEDDEEHIGTHVKGFRKCTVRRISRYVYILTYVHTYINIIRRSCFMYEMRHIQVTAAGFHRSK